MANLESLNKELKSLQHHIEAYISEEDYSTDLTRFMEYQRNIIDGKGDVRRFVINKKPPIGSNLFMGALHDSKQILQI